MTLNVFLMTLMIVIPYTQCQDSLWGWCSCTDIQTQQQCEDPAYYQGICSWTDGQCSEMTCQQRTNQTACEPDWGLTWCAWVDGTHCIRPTTCSDISLEKWCPKSGCLWVAANEQTTEYKGQCTGQLNQYSCANLSPSLCQTQYYFYNYFTDGYDLCELDSQNRCYQHNSCYSQTTSFGCGTDFNCKWMTTCVPKECQDFTTSSECGYFASYDNGFTVCTWNNNTCVPLDCSSLTTETDCTNKTTNASRICMWSGSCKPMSCSLGTSQSQCTNDIFPAGGFQSCTWLDSQGACSPCNQYGPALIYNSDGTIIVPSSSVTLTVLSTFVLALILV